MQARRGWPAVRTVPVSGGWPLWRPLLAGLVAALVGAVLLGAALLTVHSALQVLGPSGLAMSVLEGFGFMTLYSPMISWVGLLVALPAAGVALRQGRAGWLMAVGVGVPVGAVIYSLIAGTWTEALVIGGVFGAELAMLFWLGMRLTAPAAFPRQPPHKW